MSDDPHTLPLPGFEAPPARRDAVEPAPPSPELERIADALPPAVRLGTSSWSFPGWAGIVWSASHERERLAREGLGAYAAHPLLRAVGLDSTYYRPLGARQAETYRAAVDRDFRFLAKAHAHCTLARFPQDPRHGAEAGQANPRFLDPTYAVEAAIAPLVEGLGDRLGAIVFQFPPHPTRALGGAERVIERLHRFLTALPAGPLYTVEIRNADWLDAEYASALRDAGAVHCLSVHPRMPPPETQAQIAAPAMERALIARWNLGHGLGYEAARARFSPFDRLAAEDPATRDALAMLIAARLAACPDAPGSASIAPILVTVNNKAEGSAPLSVFELAGRVCDLLDAQR